MAKRRIHLTEGQLYGLVESALNELDWRTYASAANKMAQSWPYKEDSYKRSVALRDAAKDAFKQQNGAEIDMYADKYPMYSYKGMRNDLNLTHFRDNEKGIDPGRWNGYPEDVDDENGDPIEGIAPEVAQDWENIDKIASFANGWDTYDKEKGKWRTRPTKWVWNDKEGKSHKEFADESFARKVTESVMRKLRESEDVDDVQKYEDALLGASLFRETAKYPYYYELRRIGEVGIGFNGNVNISNRYGDRVVLTPQAADELIKRGIVQTGDLYGTVMLFRNPQERGEALRQMVNILKTHHPNLQQT